MRYGFIALLCAFVLVTGMVYVFAQDRPPRPEGEGPGGFGPRPGREGADRPDRPGAMRQPMPGMGPTAAMELSGSTLFLVSGTKVFKVNTTEMKLEAQRDLAEADSSEASTPEDVLKKLDTNGDGKVSRDEWTGPPQAFDKLDANADGAITKEEIPADLVQRARRLLKAPVRAGGPAAIKVATTSLYVYLGGKLYKLKVSDLAIEGSLDIETPDQERVPAQQERRRAKQQREREQGAQPEGDTDKPKKKKKEGDDFGF